MVANNVQRKIHTLRDLLGSHQSVGIAFSGGVDSTLLAKIAHDVLGSNMHAITIASHVIPRREVKDAGAWCAAEGIQHEVIPFDELAVPGFQSNPPDRCYHCKRALFKTMLAWCDEHGIEVLAEGSNVDDMGDYRPGLRAIEELGVLSPLRQAGFTKHDIRIAARSLGIPMWNKPSAACLASRIAYGEPITTRKLEMIEQAEELLHGMGFFQTRVRVHGSNGEVARIEVPKSEIARLVEDETRETVNEHMRNLGFTYVAVDTTGFRSGSMNEVL